MMRTSLGLFLVVLCTASALPARSTAAAPAHAEADSRQARSADWCAGHGVPESKCTKCNPSLIPQFRADDDWCAGHGFPESVCPSCRPQTPPAGDAPVADWCLEHGLPESKCTKCSPGLVAAFVAADDWCSTHGFPESVCPTCNPQSPPPGVERAAIEARTVRLQEPGIEGTAGIETTRARRLRTTAFLECAARIAFNADRIADVRSAIPGVVRNVRVELGARVDEGTPLFEIASPRIGEIQGSLQTARERVRAAEADLARLRELRRGDIASARQVEVAQRELAAARASASAAETALGVAGANDTMPSGRIVLRAPISGNVVRRPAVLGQLASEEDSLATVADTTTMWAYCDIAEADAGRVEIGQAITLRTEGDPPHTWEGRITWVAAAVDRRTRTVTAHAVVPNPDGRLRANQFAQARIATNAARQAVVVPSDALQRVGELEVVFVRVSPGVYEPRVVVRAGSGDPVPVEGRVREGDEVVTTGAYLLRTEILPGSIGAGCCEVDPRGDD